jgi:iron-sulfur cluster assembly accessory protein
MSMHDTATEELPVVTANAAKRIAKVLSSEPEGSMLRVAVKGGGCSGFQYTFDIVPAKDEEDLVLERDGVKVLIDAVSLDFLKGAKIDFVDSLIGQSFQIDNPNATAACGCGTSFSI